MGAPLERRFQLAHLLVLGLRGRTTTKELMQSTLGALVYPFKHRRCPMCTLGSVCRWCKELHDERVLRAQSDIFDELLGALVALPLAETNIRSPVSTQLYCWDAIPTTAGICTARVSRALARNCNLKCCAIGSSYGLSWDSVRSTTAVSSSSMQ